MKECDIFSGGQKHILTLPTYFQGSNPNSHDPRPWGGCGEFVPVLRGCIVNEYKGNNQHKMGLKRCVCVFVCCCSSNAGVTNVLHVSKESSQGSTLNYAKIKSDLASPNVHYQTRGLLLQALRWVSLPAFLPICWMVYFAVFTSLIF